MSEKPSYVGLLNLISVGESNAECYLDAWANVTPHPGVRQVISTVALREGEHGKAFAKRLCELGYTVEPTDNPQTAEKMAIAASTTLTDKEKFEQLNLCTENAAANEFFSNVFKDTEIDIQTGGLLGRYIAEERDSGRMLRGCYAELCAESDGPASNDALEARLTRIEDLLDKLVVTKAKK
jgi:hypothetical protein